MKIMKKLTKKKKQAYNKTFIALHAAITMLASQPNIKRVRLNRMADISLKAIKYLSKESATEDVITDYLRKLRNLMA